MKLNPLVLGFLAWLAWRAYAQVRAANMQAGAALQRQGMQVGP